MRNSMKYNIKEKSLPSAIVVLRNERIFPDNLTLVSRTPFIDERSKSLRAFSRLEFVDPRDRAFRRSRVHVCTARPRAWQNSNPYDVRELYSRYELNLLAVARLRSVEINVARNYARVS